MIIKVSGCLGDLNQHTDPCPFLRQDFIDDYCGLSDRPNIEKATATMPDECPLQKEKIIVEKYEKYWTDLTK